MTATHTTNGRSVKSERIGLRATSAQEAVLRRAAAVCQKSLTEFIMESACQAAEQTLLDQRLFMVSDERFQQLLELLDRTAGENPGLRDLFAKPAPWD